MDDEFEVELRIDQLEKAYAIASSALQHARNTLQQLRTEASTKAEAIAKAERRCVELARRRTTLRRLLDELEDPGTRTSHPPPATGRSQFLS
jgi:septal ring factor EnvC (AmiA/AmiB activator)